VAVAVYFTSPGLAIGDRRVDRIVLRGEVVEGGLDVDGLPEHDDVDHDAEAVEHHAHRGRPAALGLIEREPRQAGTRGDHGTQTLKIREFPVPNLQSG